MSTTVAPDNPGGALETQDRYKWTVLSNTTLGIFMSSLDASIVLISMPAIFRGIGLDPLQPSNVVYLLWMLMGYMVVTAALVVTLGRLGDIFGRVKMYNAGFLVFSLASLALSLCPWTGSHGAMWLIAWRVVQGTGGALIMANSTAILTDAFPVKERGMAMGINMVAAIAGSFIGLIAGGFLADIHWRAVFWINVPIGLFGTAWAYWKLREVGTTTDAKIDWWGNLTFAVGLVMVLIGITYGLMPHGHSNMGWTGPWVLFELIGGIAILLLFVWIETRVDDPMFHVDLFKIRAFSFGNLSGLLSSIGRGGLQFMLIIWLQGIWLPLHGYSFERTPLWAGIYMLPLTLGFLLAGPTAGWLSDRYGARPFATGGMIGATISFILLMFLPADFSFPIFASLLLLNGLSMGVFAAPNTTGIMNAVPPAKRGAANGMRMTFFNAGMLLSIGLFFSLMVAGLSSSLPSTMSSGLRAQGVPVQVADGVAHEPPVADLFAAFLGYNPMKGILSKIAPDGRPLAADEVKTTDEVTCPPGDVSLLCSLPEANRNALIGKTFFPNLISKPFKDGLFIAFSAAALMCLIAAAASWLRGGYYVNPEEAADMKSESADLAGAVASGGVVDAAPGSGEIEVTVGGGGRSR
ncbi:MAG: MFS transporter [Actinobacteria bacterium]|nr:MFS transporter [Actinomycetota bacterium]